LGKALKTSQIIIHNLGTCTHTVTEGMTARQSVGFVEGLDADFASSQASQVFDVVLEGL
jgi:hypothetical protein